MFNTTEYFELEKIGVEFTPGDGRTAKMQAAYQIACLAVTVGIALIGGFITGKDKGVVHARYFLLYRK